MLSVFLAFLVIFSLRLGLGEGGRDRQTLINRSRHINIKSSKNYNNNTLKIISYGLE
jgi:hypothetical protein